MTQKTLDRIELAVAILMTVTIVVVWTCITIWCESHGGCPDTSGGY